MTASNTRARQLLAQAGRELYGDQWQMQLARDLGLSYNSNSLRDWLNGKNVRFDMSHWAWPKIQKLLRDTRTPATIRLADTIRAETLPTPVQKPKGDAHG